MSTATMTSNYFWQNLQIVYTEGYYNELSYADPISFGINYYNSLSLNRLSQNTLRYSYIRPNEVRMADGSKDYFYTVHHEPHNFYDATYQYFLSDYYFIDNVYNIYEQETLYEPVWTPMRNLESLTSTEHRDLDVKKTEELMPLHYFIFYVLAQLGGLYAMFVLIFGFFVGYVARKAFNQDMINNLYRYNMNNPNQEMNQEMMQEDMHLSNQPQYMNNQKQHDMYDGGDDYNYDDNQMDQDPQAMLYNNSDLWYSIFGCKSSDTDPTTKAGRYKQLQKEVEVLNEERDMVHVVSSLSTIKNRLDMLEQKLQEEEAKVQRANEKQQIDAPVKKQTIKQAPEPIYQTDKQMSYVNNQPGQPIPVPKVEKKQNPSSSISQILDGIENTRTKGKDEIQNINNIIESEINAMKNESQIQRQGTEKQPKKIVMGSGQPAW